jgi:hypothetical protein
LTSSTDYKEVAMNHIHPIRRLAGILAGFAGALLAFTAASPAALAVRVPPPGGSRFHPARPATVTVVAGGMPGWQIALIAVAAAVIAAALAVIVDRAWAARRHARARTA